MKMQAEFLSWKWNGIEINNRSLGYIAFGWVGLGELWNHNKGELGEVKWALEFGSWVS